MINEKGYITDNIRYAPGEKRKLISALEDNDKEKVLDIIFAIYYRGDLFDGKI